MIKRYEEFKNDKLNEEAPFNMDRYQEELERDNSWTKQEEVRLGTLGADVIKSNTAIFEQGVDSYMIKKEPLGRESRFEFYYSVTKTGKDGTFGSNSFKNTIGMLQKVISGEKTFRYYQYQDDLDYYKR